MSTTAAAAASSAPSTPAAAAGGAAPASAAPSTPAAGAAPVDPKATPAGASGGAAAAGAPGAAAEGKPDGEGGTPKPADAAAAQSDAERRLLAQVGRASKAEREAGKQVAEARAKISELEGIIAGHGTVAERAKAADQLEASLKDLNGAVKLLAKHGHKFEDVVKAWGEVGEESPELAELRAEQAKLREAQEKRDKADADAKKAKDEADARAAFEEGVKEAKALLTSDEKRWRMASNPDDADEVVESVRVSVVQHIAEKRKTSKDYAPTEEQVRELFAKGYDQAEKHLRDKAKRYAERLAEETKAAEAAKTEEARNAVAEAGAVTPKTPSKGRALGMPADPLGAKKPEPAAEASPTISGEVRGSLPVPELKRPPLSGGKREMGRPVQSLTGR